MKFIKRFSVLLVAAIVVLTLVGCGGKNTDKADVLVAKELLVIEDILDDNESADKVTKNLVLKTRIGEMVELSWSSNNKEAISDNGKVTRSLDGDKDVKLTATLSKGKALETKTFELKVLARNLAEEVYEVSAKYTGDTTYMVAGNNAETLGLDQEIFNVVSTARQLTPENLHVGLNKDGSIRLYGSFEYESKSTLTILVAEGFKITDIEVVFMQSTSNPDSGVLTLGDEEKALGTEELAAGTVTYNELSIDGFSIRNTQVGGKVNTQIWIEEISVTYVYGEANNKFTPIKTNKVEFESNGGTEVKDYLFEENDDLKLPGILKAGHEFNGWYLESNFTTKVTEDYELTKDIKLYAKWNELTDQMLVDEAKAALTIDTADITTDKTLALPKKGLNDVVVTWEVIEGADLIDLETGKVTHTGKNTTLKLKAILTLNDAESSKEFLIELVVVTGNEDVLMIYEIYGAGGNKGAFYNSDFVTLYNGTSNDIDLSTYSLKYAAAKNTTSFSNSVKLTGTILSKGYFIIKLSGGTNGDNLPHFDMESTGINMAASAGKVALVTGEENPTGPDSSNVIDFVGFGTTANQFEGTKAAPAPSATKSIRRKALIDSNDNGIDFEAVTLA